MTASTVIGNARVVLADEVVKGSVEVRDGTIVAIALGSTTVPGAIDLEGGYLIPGLVEIHTDNLEQHLMPRPNTSWPALPALLAHDAELAAAGITTVYDALGVGDSDMSGLRGQSMALVLDSLALAIRGKLLRVDHRLHVRCELPAANTRELFEPFHRHPLVGLISLMDHTPGQRQWSNIEHARVYYTGKKGWTDERFERAVAESGALQLKYARTHRDYFVDYARRYRIPLASHDDTLEEHVIDAYEEGIAISEFPTSVKAAAKARELGLAVVMGAPNVVRGASHSGNVSALALGKRRLLDVLSSDYVPAGLLLAGFALQNGAEFTVPEAIATVTRNPARAVGLEDRGEIAIGQRADLVHVRMVDATPVVRAVWREGQRVV